MDLRPRDCFGWVIPVLLAFACIGCASGPPGSAYSGTGLVLHTKQPPPKAQGLSQEAQAFLEELGGYLQLQVPPGRLLKIYHYPNRWGLWQHLNREVPSLRWRKGVCYETEEAFVVTLSGRPERKGFQKALRHELTHYLVATHFCNVPPWIDEGLAQVMASGPPFPHLEQDLLKTVRREARNGKERGCLRLLHVPPGKKLSPSQYRIACALTYDLLSRSPKAAPGRLLRFLETTHPDAPPEQTFFNCWGTSMEEACQALVLGTN